MLKPINKVRNILFMFLNDKMSTLEDILFVNKLHLKLRKTVTTNKIS
jgi:hypothetical protein